MQPNKLMTITDVSDYLGVERHKASDLMKTMPCLILPGTRTKRVRLIDLENWISSHVVVQAEAETGKRKKTHAKAAPQYDPELFEPDGRLKRRR